MTTDRSSTPRAEKPRFVVRWNGVVEPKASHSEIEPVGRGGIAVQARTPRPDADAAMPAGSIPHSRDGASEIAHPQGDVADQSGAAERKAPAANIGRVGGDASAGGGHVSDQESSVTIRAAEEEPQIAGNDPSAREHHSAPAPSSLASVGVAREDDLRVISSLDFPPGPRAPAAFSGVRVGDHCPEPPPFLDRRDAASRAWIEAALAMPSTREEASA